MTRKTHRYDGELVVFLIGMTITKWWRPDLWLPTFLAMRPMLKELAGNPSWGMLGYRLVLEAGGPTVVQYWDSVEKLYSYAGHQDAAHRPAWAKFNRSAGKAKGAAGVWHETYLVDKAESVYVGTPTMGLARFTEEVPVLRNSARERIAESGSVTAMSR